MAGPAIFCSTFKPNASKRKLNSLGNAQLPLPTLLSSRVFLFWKYLTTVFETDFLFLISFLSHPWLRHLSVCMFQQPTALLPRLPLPGVSHVSSSGENEEVNTEPAINSKTRMSIAGSRISAWAFFPSCFQQAFCHLLGLSTNKLMSQSTEITLFLFYRPAHK